jgi:hypothetical protein
MSSIDGGQMDLQPMELPVTILAGDSVSLGQSCFFIGDLAGMNLLEQLTGNGGNNNNRPAAVVLGLDFLKEAYQLILHVRKQEVWFEELRNDQLKELQ